MPAGCLGDERRAAAGRAGGGGRAGERGRQRDREQRGDGDVVLGNEGDDRINVVDGSVDRVDCGAGSDTVFADVLDVVTATCERVRR